MVRGKVPQKSSTKRVTVASSSRAHSVASPATNSANDKSKSVFKAGIPNCCGCGKYIAEETRALQCDRCQKGDGWKCIECLNISNSVYESLLSDASPNLRWFCEECDEVVMGTTSKFKIDDLVSQIDRLSSKLEKLETKVGDVSEIEACQQRLEDKVVQMTLSIEDKLAALAGSKRDSSAVGTEAFEASQKRLEDQMVQMAVSIEDKFEALKNGERLGGAADNNCEETAHRRLETKVDDMMKVIGTQQLDTAKLLEGAIKVQTEEARAEEEERTKRKANIVVHGLSEPTGATAVERENEDKQLTEDLLHVLSCDTVSVRQVTRLGALPVNGTSVKSRPLSITFESEGSKEHVLKKAKNLRKKEGGWERVFLHQDLTPSQREARKVLVQELHRRKNSGETNLVILNGKICTRRIWNNQDTPVQQNQTVQQDNKAEQLCH